mgnify:CR=1 FL=1
MKLSITGKKLYKDGKLSALPLFINDGIIVSEMDSAENIFDFSDKYYIFPGFVDVHVHLREPGFSYKETIKSGTLASAHGGYTAVCSMPNLNPVPDSRENLNKQLEIIEKDACIHVYPYGSITVGQMGEELSDMEAMADNVIAFSDDGRGVQSDDMMRSAMLRAKALGKMIVAHCEVNELLRGGKIEPSLCNKLYRREILMDSCLDASVTNNEDLLRNFTLFSRANKSVFEDFCGYQYWRRTESMSNKGFQAKKYHDVLQVRALILKNAQGQVRSAAMQSYINALISSYNAAIGNTAQDTCQLAVHCRAELKRLKAELGALPTRLRLRGMAILHVPGLYQGLLFIHESQVRRKIKTAAARAQKE